MRLSLNHGESYSAEQMAAMLLGSAALKDDSDGGQITSELFGRTARASAEVGGRTAFGECEAADDYVSALRYAVKLSIYRAVTGATGVRPAWGALSGVRPAKLAAKYLASGEEACAKTLVKLYELRPDKARLAAHCAAVAETALGAAEKSAPEGRSPCIAYAGIPYCPSRCAYCSFVSLAGSDGTEIESYLAALAREIAQKGERIREGGWSVAAGYVGGGTPTVLTPSQLDALLTAMERAFGAPYTGELTVESGRPDTIDREKLAALRSHGVTRVCVNPQTLSETALALARRNHTAADFFRAYELAASMGFDVNTDLIAGLDGETPESFESGLRRIIALAPANITVHSLAKKRAAELVSAKNATMELVDRSAELLYGAGYEPYYVYRQKNTADGAENVGWARDGKRSAYNILMMEELAPVFACGAGAVTKVIAGGAFRRETNPKYPREYVGGGSRTD